MKKRERVQIAIGLLLLVASIRAFSLPMAANAVRGFTITEIGTHLYDASADPAFKTEAQIIADRLYNLGVRHIVLSPRGLMTDPRSATIYPKTTAEEQPAERERYLRFINYLHSKGMSVGIRPLLFVVDANGNTPLEETLPNGMTKVWWHGNIQPADPATWFISLRNYHSFYLDIAKAAKAEEYTLGAELASMMIGIGKEWSQYPMGFPDKWNEFAMYARSVVGPEVRLMYDANYTDAVLLRDSQIEDGGEFAKLKYRVVDMANPTEPAERENWLALKAFLRNLDGLGIDMYRSLASQDQQLPDDWDALIALLHRATDKFAMQVDGFAQEISGELEMMLPVTVKEVGYRSVEKGFVDPFVYAGSGDLSIEHQAAAMQALAESFGALDESVFRGIVFWDASVDLNRHGPEDLGFSPLGKPVSEDVLKYAFTPFEEGVQLKRASRNRR